MRFHSPLRPVTATRSPTSSRPRSRKRLAGALGVLLEKQGNPLEQCGLLVYLLRRCGIPAGYVFAPDHGVKLLDTRLSRTLRMQVRGAVNQFGNAYAWLVSTGQLANVSGPAVGGLLIAQTGAAAWTYLAAAGG